MKYILTLLTALLLAPLAVLSQPATTPGRGAETVSINHSLLDALHSPILFKGDERIGYRDPLLLWHDSTFHLFFTLGEREGDTVYLYLAKSTSRDLHTWTPTQKLSVRDLSLNFVSLAAWCDLAASGFSVPRLTRSRKAKPLATEPRGSTCSAAAISNGGRNRNSSASKAPIYRWKNGPHD
jgi:hypothetical protein